MESNTNSKKCLYEILVPTVSRTGKPFRTRYHKVWDKHVEGISGGLTILTPGKGTWLHEGQTVRERMIPVRIMCTREEIDKIVDMTIRYYDQLAVMAYRVSDEIILRHRVALR